MNSIILSLCEANFPKHAKIHTVATKFIDCAYDPEMTIDETPEIICYCTIQLYSKLIN